MTIFSATIMRRRLKKTAPPIGLNMRRLITIITKRLDMRRLHHVPPLIQRWPNRRSLARHLLTDLIPLVR